MRTAIFEKLSAAELREKLHTPSSERFFQIYEAFKKGVTVDEVVKQTKIGKWFLTQIWEMAHRFVTLSRALQEDIINRIRHAG